MIELLPIQAESVELVWNSIRNYALADSSFSAKILQNDVQLYLSMEIDPGTGLSRAWEYSLLQAVIPDSEKFAFSIKDADLIDKLKKLFTKNIVKTGSRKLDQRLVIKSNNTSIVKQLLQIPDVAQFVTNNQDFEFGIYVRYIHNGPVRHKVLEIRLNKAIRNPELFKLFYRAFYSAFGIIVPH